MTGKQGPEPIAIVGMGCRWSGGVRDLPGLWEFLLNKRSGYQDWAEPRFSAEGFYHPNPERPGTTAAKGGYTLIEDPRLFDPSFFEISGLEAETMDPSQRKLLEVVYEAFENAGDTWESVNGKNIGVYVADISYDNAYAQSRDWEYARPHATTGSCHNIISNRINYVFNLRGPSVTIDSACTSALYGLHMAAQAIRDGDCDSAIVATANYIMDPSMQIAMDKLGALSATSMSHAFDASADGYGRGEGFAAIYLKKPENSMKDGSPIRALFRGSAIGANGRSSGITHPSGAAQEMIIRKAYENAGGLLPSQTPFLECHGTGTRVGDPLEVEAAGKVFGPDRSDKDEDRLLIGSVKTNLGHTEGAAALASIFKVILALEAGVIPPSIGVNTLNPKIDFDKAKAKVVTEPVPWPHGKLRRVSVTSAGFGGSIGHCILDHVNTVYPDYIKPGILQKTVRESTNGVHHTSGPKHVPVTKEPPKDRRADADTRQLVLLPFSAHSETSLKANIQALSPVVHQHSLADVAYTLAARRSKLTQRTFRILDKKNASSGLLTDDQRVFSSSLEVPRLCFVFTGQGAQWSAMGAQLFEYRIFRVAIEYLDHILELISEDRSWIIADILTGNCDAKFVDKPEVSQTVCTAVQIGLVDLLASWSIRPSGVVGHSSGEIAAAYASGHINAAEAITSAYLRGQAVSLNKQPGSMLAVGLGLESISAHLLNFEQDIKIAAINSPASLTLSGEQEAVEKLSNILTDEGVFNRLLRTGGNAYHSHHMQALGHEYEALLSKKLAYLERLGLRDQYHTYPKIPWVSTVTPHESIPQDVSASYWRANLESTVRFSEAVVNIFQQKDLELGALVEIGPHPALKGPLDQILKSISKTPPYSGSLKRGEDARRSLMQLAGFLFGINAEIDLTAVNATDWWNGTKWVMAHGVTATDLPIYQYTYGPISYYESRPSKEFRYRTVPRHDLIGSKIPGSAKLRPQFRNVLRLKDLPWLGDHRLIPDVVFPAAGYIAMAMVAASQVYREFSDALQILGYSIRNVDIKTALKIPEDSQGIEVVLSMELSSEETAKVPGWSSFSVSSVTRDSNQWTEHCTGLIKLDTSKIVDADRIEPASDSRAVDAKAWYKTFSGIGLGYGPAFRALSDIHADSTENLAFAKLGLKTTEGTIRGGESSYPIHPASLDALIQLGLLACHGGQAERADTAFVPTHLSQLKLRDQGSQNWGNAIAHGEFRGQRSALLQLQLYSQDGDQSIDIKDLRCTRYSLVETAPDHEKINSFASPFMRMLYKPDFRALSSVQARDLLPPPTKNITQTPALDSLESIAALVAIAIYEKHKSNKDQHNSECMGNYLNWLKMQVEENPSDRVLEMRSLSFHKRLELLQTLFQENAHLVETKVLRRLHGSMAEIFQGTRTGEQVLAEGDLLSEFFDKSLLLAATDSQIAGLFDLIGHADPGYKILEIKGGRGRTASLVLEALSSMNGIKRYQEFTVTDVSEPSLKPARERLSQFLDVGYSVLDIEQDPLKQGFEPVYDLVLASQAIHTSESIVPTLENIRKLLRPGGKLVLIETKAPNSVLSLIGGTLTGYWRGMRDGRISTPFLDRESWSKALHSAGFNHNEIILDDYPSPMTQSHIMVSSSSNSVDTTTHTNIWLLHGLKGPPPLLTRLAYELKCQNIVVKISPLYGAQKVLVPEARVIAFLDDENLLLDADEQCLETFQYLAHNTATMIWLTSTGMAKGRSPNGAIVGGLLRTISTEAPSSRFCSIDIDADGFKLADEDASEIIRVIIDQEEALQQQSEGDEDREFAWHSGCLWVSRLVPEELLQGYEQRLKTPTTCGIEMLPLDSQGPVRAAFEKPGLLSSLFFQPYSELRQQPLPKDWIEVKVAAVGLNWKDLALAIGRFEGNNLSSEYAGFVTRAGTEAAKRFAIGDLVYGLGKGHFGNYSRVPAGLAQKAQSHDDPINIATMPVVFMTAVYAFEYLTCLRKGQKVLIQSASGGVGLGAIQLARAKGAEVFAMAGSSEKIQFLTEEVGLPRSHVFKARDLADLARAVAATGKGGFDIILSTAQGDLLHDTLAALAPLGHLIDIGRLNVNEAKTIGLELFHKSASFSSFDLARVVESDPELGSQLMQAVDEHYRAGHIGPIQPVTVSDISKLDQTLLSFSKGTHIGKLVISFQNPDSRVRMVQALPAVAFDPEACYIITGGLSGLGRSIIQWLSDRGARELVVLSRRGDSAPEARELVNILAKRGVHLHPQACDLGDRMQVMRAVERASSIRPVKGVIHCAVSYQDISFDKISLESWRDGLNAKVYGTWNLHEATKTLPMDFFVMTTSILSVLSFATQGSYTAANNFQDQFARYRHRLGLPATAAQFGLVNDVGHLSTDATTLDLMARNKVMTLPESVFLRLLEPAFLDPSSSTQSADLEFDPLAAATYVTYMSPAQMAANQHIDDKMDIRSIVTPRWYNDARVSHVIRGFNDALRYLESGQNGSGTDADRERGLSATMRIRRDFDSVMRKIRSASAGADTAEQLECHSHAESLVTEAIKSTVATMLLLDISAINMSRAVADHGLDSLIATELRSWFHQALGFKISMVDLLDPHTSITALVARVVDNVTADGEGK